MDAFLDRKGLSVSDIVGGYSQGVQGKGDRPRSWGQKYADNYSLIDWSKKSDDCSGQSEDLPTTPFPEPPCRSDG